MREIEINGLVIPENLREIPVVGVGAIIPFSNQLDKILCVVEAEERPELGKFPGMTSFPMGHRNLDEDPNKAVFREVLEETGYEIELDYLIGLYIATDKVAGLLYAAKETGPINLDSSNRDKSIKDVRWVDGHEILYGSLNLRPGVKVMVEDYFRGVKMMVRDLRA